MTQSDWQSKLTIIIPAYNEEKGLPVTLANIRDKLPLTEVIVVDDASTDATYENATNIDEVRVLRHAYNCGYGGSLKTGMVHAKTEYVAWFDADGEHQVEDLIAMMDLATNKKLIAVIGQRKTGSSSSIRAAGKWVIKLLARSLDIRAGSDLNCGLRIFKRNVICRYLSVLPEGYSASLTSLMIMLEQNYPIEFFSIETKPRIGKSKVKLADGFSTMSLVLRVIMLFAPLRIFFRGGALLLLFSVIYSIYMALTIGSGVPVGGALGILAGGLLLAVGLIADQISQLRLLQLSSNIHLPERPVAEDSLSHE